LLAAAAAERQKIVENQIFWRQMLINDFNLTLLTFFKNI
jgi:hypothetical protein